MKTKLIILIAALLLIAGCQVPVSTRSSASSSYSEDLAAYRPTVEDMTPSDTSSSQLEKEEFALIEPTHHINVYLDSILDSIAITDKRQNYYQGYTIMLYTGSSREQATMARGLVRSLELDVEPDLVYNQPNYKVKVGQFLTRLEAQPLFTELKKEFSNAIVAPERIYIKD